MTLHDIRHRLGILSEKMSELIRKYEMNAESPLDVISIAQSTISDPKDYILFLELSLEGRILADEGERLIQAERVVKEPQYLQ